MYADKYPSILSRQMKAIVYSMSAKLPLSCLSSPPRIAMLTASYHGLFFCLICFFFFLIKVHCTLKHCSKHKTWKSKGAGAVFFGLL